MQFHIVEMAISGRALMMGKKRATVDAKDIVQLKKYFTERRPFNLPDNYVLVDDKGNVYDSYYDLVGDVSLLNNSEIKVLSNSEDIPHWGDASEPSISRISVNMEMFAALDKDGNIINVFSAKDVQILRDCSNEVETFCHIINYIDTEVRSFVSLKNGKVYGMRFGCLEQYHKSSFEKADADVLVFTDIATPPYRTKMNVSFDPHQDVKEQKFFIVGEGRVYYYPTYMVKGVFLAASYAELVENKDFVQGAIMGILSENPTLKLSKTFIASQNGDFYGTDLHDLGKGAVPINATELYQQSKKLVPIRMPAKKEVQPEQKVKPKVLTKSEIESLLGHHVIIKE